jgi:hypothetical protein
MSTNSATGSSVDPNALVEEKSNDGIVVTYACEYHTGKFPTYNSTGQTENVTIEHFYDVVHNCSASVPEAATTIAQQLLVEAAEVWKILPSGEACSEPQNTYGAWLFGVSSKGEHTMISDFGCQRLTPNSSLSECCHVIRSEMIFLPTGGYNVSELERFIHEFLNTTHSEEYRTASIEPVFLEDIPMDDSGGRGGFGQSPTVTGAQDGADSSSTQKSSNGGQITLTGGFLIACLVAVVAGVFLVLFRRHRKDQSELNASGNTLDKDDDLCNSTLENGPSCAENDFQVTVLHDHTYNSFPAHRCISRGSIVTEPEVDVFESQLEENEEEEDCLLPKAYAFDLSEAFKNNVMGTCAAPTVMQVMPPYPIVEETSCDSEADDSWAQTDGTVGSIEDRLEVITGEI